MDGTNDVTGFETLAIHAGQEPDPATGSVVPPIYQTSTYKQDGIGGLRGGYEYSRTGNPTRTALEECLAAIEGGVRGLAFASGMAAEDTLLRTVCKPGDHVVNRGGIDVDAVEQSAPSQSTQVHRVNPGQRSATLADRGTHGVDDVRLCH